jgi:uncharacterized protein (TIGR02246 family)
MNEDRFALVADRFEIAALSGEFVDAGVMKDYDRFASLFTEDGRWAIPLGGLEFTGRAAIRAGVERAQGVWELFVQTVHPGSITVDGDTATGRVYVVETGRFRDGGSHRNESIYHDRYRRTGDGWRFAERVYEVRYLDQSPLTGTVSPTTVELPEEV